MKETGVDCLAVAVGTSHGVYRGKPHLNFELLSELSREVSVPFVLHGGSNTGEEKLKKAITLGIQKINLSTDLSTEYLIGVRKFKEENDPLLIMRENLSIPETGRCMPTRHWQRGQKL